MSPLVRIPLQKGKGAPEVGENITKTLRKLYQTYKILRNIYYVYQKLSKALYALFPASKKLSYFTP